MLFLRYIMIFYVKLTLSNEKKTQNNKNNVKLN